MTKLDNKLLYNIKDAANFIGVSTKTLRRWEKAGKIKSYRTIGNHRRYKKTDIEKIMRI